MKIERGNPRKLCREGSIVREIVWSQLFHVIGLQQQPSGTTSYFFKPECLSCYPKGYKYVDQYFNARLTPVLDAWSQADAVNVLAIELL